MMANWYSCPSKDGNSILILERSPFESTRIKATKFAMIFQASPSAHSNPELQPPYPTLPSSWGRTR